MRQLTFHQQCRRERLNVQAMAAHCPEGPVKAPEERPVVLIACSKSKLQPDMPIPIGTLYTGDLFLKSKAYAQAIGAQWFILSAKYRVIRPDRLSFAYDDTLADMEPQQRRFWAREVAWQLKGLKDRRLIVLAGEAYCAWTEGFDVERPLKGMPIGKAKQWLKQQLEALS